jgi:hypothetical protein
MTAQLSSTNRRGGLVGARPTGRLESLRSRAPQGMRRTFLTNRKWSGGMGRFSRGFFPR